MEEYIWICQNTVKQYIAMRSMLDLCEGSEREPSVWVGMRFWEKAGINLLGEREATATAAEKYD